MGFINFQGFIFHLGSVMHKLTKIFKFVACLRFFFSFFFFFFLIEVKGGVIQT